MSAAAHCDAAQRRRPLGDRSSRRAAAANRRGVAINGRGEVEARAEGSALRLGVAAHIAAASCSCVCSAPTSV